MWRCALVVCWLSPVLGCGDSKLATYPASGRVAFTDGKPLSGGTVELRPVRQQDVDPSAAETGAFCARGLIQPDGAFELSTFAPGDGATEGEHVALIVPPIPPGRIDPTIRPKPVINPRFQNYGTSGLKFTVTPEGPNEFEIIVERP